MRRPPSSCPRWSWRRRPARSCSGSRRPATRCARASRIVEIETDKVTVEIEAPASGVLRDVTAQAGDVVPVGQTIALIFAAGEAGAARRPRPGGARGGRPTPPPRHRLAPAAPAAAGVKASPLARKVAEQHGVDLAAGEAASGRIEKADVLAYVERPKAAGGDGQRAGPRASPPASPKARRLAAERGVDLHDLRGSGPGRRGPRRRRPRRGAAGPGAAARPQRRRPPRRRRQRLAHHGRAHDGQLDQRAALLPGARGQRRAG